MPIERLFENLALTVEPFAVCQVSPGWRLRMQGLEWVTFHFVLSGEGGLRAGRGSPQALARDRLAVVPARIPHSLESGDAVVAETTTAQALAVEGDLMQFVAGPPGAQGLVVACGRLQATYAQGLGLFDTLHEPLVLDFSASAEMRETFARVLEEERRRPPGERAMLSALMNQCLVLVFRRLYESPYADLPWLNALEDPRLGPVIAAILEAPDRPHTLDSLAAEAFMGRSQFAQQFSARFGRTPMAFVRDVRVRRGAELLRRTPLSIDAVARRVGYASRSQFSRAFREYFGKPPGAFRTETEADGARGPSVLASGRG